MSVSDVRSLRLLPRMICHCPRESASLRYGYRCVGSARFVAQVLFEFLPSERESRVSPAIEISSMKSRVLAGVTDAPRYGIFKQARVSTRNSDANRLADLIGVTGTFLGRIARLVRGEFLRIVARRDPVCACVESHRCIKIPRLRVGAYTAKQLIVTRC